MVTSVSIKASTFCTRRLRRSEQETSPKIVTNTSTVAPSCSSDATRSELIDCSTAVALKGHVTASSAFANERTMATMDCVGLELGTKVGPDVGDELGIVDGLPVGSRVGYDDGEEIGEAEGW